VAKNNSAHRWSSDTCRPPGRYSLRFDTGLVQIHGITFLLDYADDLSVLCEINWVVDHCQKSVAHPTTKVRKPRASALQAWVAGTEMGDQNSATGAEPEIRVI
jgi:hypothetical protein